MNGMQAYCNGAGNDRLHDLIDALSAEVEMKDKLIVSLMQDIATLEQEHRAMRARSERLNQQRDDVLIAMQELMLATAPLKPCEGTVEMVKRAIASVKENP
jgi:uncharacterized protein HemY